MKNPFADVVATAAANGWCVKLSCSTCGARDFRTAVRPLGGPSGGLLGETLAVVQPEDIIGLRGWAQAIEVAVRDLPRAAQISTLLNAWLQNVGRQIDDVVLFRIVRWLPSANDIRRRWIDALVPVAIERRDHSLVESLLLVMRRDALAHSELMEVARTLAVHSRQMRRVLRNASGA